MLLGSVLARLLGVLEAPCGLWGVVLACLAVRNSEITQKAILFYGLRGLFGAPWALLGAPWRFFGRRGGAWRRLQEISRLLAPWRVLEGILGLLGDGRRSVVAVLGPHSRRTNDAKGMQVGASSSLRPNIPTQPGWVVAAPGPLHRAQMLHRACESRPQAPQLSK